MVKRILTILLLLVSVAAYSQTTWYIDPDGSDVSGNGSITKPWASLSHATDTVTFSGDVIHVNTGTYNETAQCILAVGVSIIGEGVSSIINTTFVNASALQAAIQCASTGGIANDNSSISHFTLSGTNKTASRAIYVGYRSNVIIEHMTIIGFNAGGIYLDAGSTDSNPFATGNVIRYCTITDASHQPNDYNGSIRVRGQTNWQITNNVIDNTITAGGGNGNTIAAVRNKKGIISDNTFRRNDTELSYWNFFSEINDSRGDLQYLRNTHYGLAKSSFGGINRIDEDCTYGVDFMYNRYLNPAVGNRTNSGTTETKYCLNLEGEGHINLRVMYNYIQHYGWGIELSTPTSEDGTYWEYNWVFDSITIAYNILDGIGYADYAYSHGIRWLNESNLDGYAGTFSKILIANNTIIAHDGEYDGYTGMEIDANGTVTGFKVASNIISGFASNAINFKEHGSDSLSVSETGFYNNCLFDSGTDEVVVEEGITGTVTVTGNITTDPLFVSSSDFSLQPSSPAVDAGIDVGLTEDYDGTTVPQGSAFDIGALERVAIPTSLTGLEWEPVLSARNFKDKANFQQNKILINSAPVTVSASEINTLAGQSKSVSASLNDKIDVEDVLDGITGRDRYMSPQQIEDYITARSSFAEGKRLRFIVDVTDGSPSGGDSTIIHPEFADKQIDVYRDGVLAYYNDTTVNFIEGFRHTTTSDTITVNPVWQASEQVEIRMRPKGTWEDINITYEKNKQALLSALLGYWKLDETSGATAYDSHTTSIDGVISDSVVINQTGKLDKAYSFNGDSAFVDFGQNCRPTEAMSISLWFNHEAGLVTEEALVDNTSFSSYWHGYRVSVHSSISFFVATGTATVLDMARFSSVANGDWRHIVCTWDGTTAYIYLDNTRSTSATMSVDAAYTAGSKLYFGAIAGKVAYYEGLLDDVYIFDRALTADEVGYLWNNGDGKELIE